MLMQSSPSSCIGHMKALPVFPVSSTGAFCFTSSRSPFFTWLTSLSRLNSGHSFLSAPFPLPPAPCLHQAPYPSGLKVHCFTHSSWKACAMELKLGPCIPLCLPDCVLMPVVESPCCSSQHPPAVPDTWQVFRDFWSVWSELPDSPGCVRARAWWG